MRRLDTPRSKIREVFILTGPITSHVKCLSGQLLQKLQNCLSRLGWAIKVDMSAIGSAIHAIWPRRFRMSELVRCRVGRAYFSLPNYGEFSI